MAEWPAMKRHAILFRVACAVLMFVHLTCGSYGKIVTMGRERIVGRRLHPSFARDRRLLPSPAIKGSFLSAPPGGRNWNFRPKPTALWLPLFPYELGAYVTTLTLGHGTNAQTVTGLVDTGSGIVHFPCSGCRGDGCDKGLFVDLEYYNSSASASHIPANCSDFLAPFLVYGTTGGSVNALNCTWFRDQDNEGQVAGRLGYAGGNSATFLFFRDATSIGYVKTPPSLPPFEPLLACDFDATASSFGAGFSGIFGMNFQPASLFSQVVSSFNFANEITFCLGDGDKRAGHVISEHSGFVAFGAVKTLRPISEKLTWRTPLAYTANSGWYTATSFINVAVVGLYLDQSTILDPASPGPTYNFFMDTGTAVISYPPSLLAPLRNQLTAALLSCPLVASVEDLVETEARLVVSYKSNTTHLTAEEKDALFPTIYFQFEGTGKVPFRPSSYLISSGPPLSSGPVPGAAEFIFMANGAMSIGEIYTGVLGNAWLNRMFIQVKQDVSKGGGNVTMSLVDQCSAVTLMAA